ncbi:SURF1 family protein [Massilia jejuensis]|uniref:SURF1-like protein n=1 Tax=Massilia jejuensis TaxID=648894 RepID=A0ABW0PBN7_9BURK
MTGRHGPDHAAASGRARPRKLARLVLAGAGLFLIVLFAGLGTWQVQRLQWKRALIERVDARVTAPASAAPAAGRDLSVTKESHEYRHVRLEGYFLYDYTTPVQAVTALGAGYWLLTPLCTPDGTIVLVNRGFIPAADARERYRARAATGRACPAAGARQAGHALTGLLRMSEPGGGFLRENDPARNRWFSRDVAAIGAARGLGRLAPYFVDAGRGQDPADAPDRPVGGLTVISFQNNHLVYAITWYALALMVAAAWWYVARHGNDKEHGKARTDGSKA